VKQLIASVMACMLVCACGGGGGSNISLPQPGSSGGNTTPQKATLTLRFTVGPSTSAKKRPAYVSGNATQLVVLVNTVNGSSTLPSGVASPTTIALTTTGTSPNCTIVGSIETCTAQIPAPPGSVNYTFDLEDSSGALLATATQTFTITSGTANALSLSLGGVAATVTVTGPTLTPGTTETTALTVTAEDASGFTIGGSTPYNNPFTLRISDTSGATQLSVNGGTAATAVTVNAPTDVISVVYNGEATSNATISSGTSGVTASGTLTALAGAITLPSGTTLDNAANGGLATDPNYDQPTVFFGSTGSQQTFTAQEVGWTSAPFDQTLTTTLDSTTCGSGASAVASVASSVNAAGADSIVVNGNNAGFCKMTLSDPFLASTIVWISVTSSSLSVNGVHRT